MFSTLMHPQRIGVFVLQAAAWPSTRQQIIWHFQLTVFYNYNLTALSWHT